MASSKQSLRKTIYVGTFIRSLSLANLEILEDAAVGVDENGIIAFIEKDVKEPELDEVVEQKYGWKEPHTVKGGGDSTAFFFPGFIGQYSCSKMSHSLVNTPYRGWVACCRPSQLHGNARRSFS